MAKGRRRNLFATLPIEEEKNGIRSEVKLWRTVIDQVMADCFSDTLEIREEANKWFNEASEDFQEVCEMAGLSSNTILRIHKHFKEKGEYK